MNGNRETTDEDLGPKPRNAKPLGEVLLLEIHDASPEIKEFICEMLQRIPRDLKKDHPLTINLSNAWPSDGKRGDALSITIDRFGPHRLHRKDFERRWPIDADDIRRVRVLRVISQEGRVP